MQNQTKKEKKERTKRTQDSANNSRACAQQEAQL